MKEKKAPENSNVILAHSSRFLTELLKGVIQKSPHLRLVGEVKSPQDLPALVENRAAQWAIVPLSIDGSVPDVVRSLLVQHPSLAILALASDGARVKLVWSEPTHKRARDAPDGAKMSPGGTNHREKLLNNLSLEELMAVLRRGALWQLTGSRGGR